MGRLSGVRFLDRLATYARILPRARRNRADLLRHLVRRPALLAAVNGYEVAMLASNRVDGRLKALVQIKVGLIGCPF